MALALGVDFKLSVAGFTLDGVGTVTFGCITLYHLLNGRVTRRVTPTVDEV